MINAREEFEEDFNLTNIKCAFVFYDESGNFYGGEEDFKLKVGYSSDELEIFLSELDFEYDNDYGIKHLAGLVWFNDGSWAERYEYDGKEEWVPKYFFQIPESLLNTKDK